jgi:hypothetical protein
MKKIISYLASFVFFLTLVSFASSSTAVKPNSCFNQFRVHRQANDASLTWSVSTPDVVGFVVERSYDNEWFETVTQLGCNGNSVHKLRDTEVFPGYVHYRITAVKADGSSEHSHVETIRIVKRR